MEKLSPPLSRLESLLHDAGGSFVAGQVLAKAAGVPIGSLSNVVSQLRRRRPGLVIEGRSGLGYRVVAADSPKQTKPDKPARVDKGRAKTVLPPRPPGLLDLIPPRLAETVKTIALESGETVDVTAERLIAYGAEVHRDLVSDGENPLALRKARSEAGRSGGATRH